MASVKLPGFGEYDVPILMAMGKLTPLGAPAPNAPKWFAAIEIIHLAVDKDWLHKTTREISKYWRHKCGWRISGIRPAACCHILTKCIHFFSGSATPQYPASQSSC